MADFVVKTEVHDDALARAIATSLYRSPQDVLVLHGLRALEDPWLPKDKLKVWTMVVRGDFKYVVGLCFGDEVGIPIALPLFQSICDELSVPLLAPGESLSALSFCILSPGHPDKMQEVDIRDEGYSKDPPEFYIDNGFPRLVRSAQADGSG